MKPAALRAKVGKRRAHHLDRADEVRIDLMCDLRIRDFLGRAEEAVARVVDHDFDSAKVGEGLVNDAPDRRRIGHVESREPELVAVLRLEAGHRLHLADSARDAITAREKLLGHVAPEATVHAGDEPVAFHGCSLCELRTVPRWTTFSGFGILAAMTHIP
jgi:hypothetical protein